MISRDRIVIALTASAVGFATIAAADDWPTYRHDNQRSGATAENLAAAKLVASWMYRSSQPPQPAWAGAADVDAYRKQRGLGDTRQYDPVFHCVVAGECVYFGSSADDALHCLDLMNGQEKWAYTSGGPIRVAPAVAEGRVYFGSDDGFAYALNAGTGEMDWRFRPPCPETRVVNDGRLISPWPCRTGVLVDGGTAYFAMSLLPWKPTFLCAVDAATGRVEGTGRYVRRVEEGLTLEAAMLASATQLIAPQGRSGTVVLRRDTGEQLTALPGASTFAVVTPGDALVSGPFSRDIGLRGTGIANQQQLAWHPRAIALVAHGKDVFLLGQDGVSATRPGATPEQLWSTPLTAARTLILAGDALFVGCDGKVLAIDRSSGKIIWQDSVEGRAYGLAVGGGTLIVSTDEGCVYGFRPSDTRLPASADAAGDRPPTPDNKPPLEPVKGLSVPLAAAPYVQFVAPCQAVVRWQTKKPSPTVLRYTIGSHVHHVYDAATRSDHSASMSGLPLNREVTYEILASNGQQVGIASGGTIDTFFNYSTRPLPSEANPYDATVDERVERLAERILAHSQTTGGVCLVMGSTDGRLAWELARQSQLRVIVVDENADHVRQLRDRWHLAGVYGARLSATHVASLDDAPLPSMLANLIVDQRLMTQRQPSASARVIARLLRPLDGLAYVGPSNADDKLADSPSYRALTTAGLKPELRAGPADGSLFVRRERLAGSGDWSHQYGAADNAGYAGESLAGCRAASDLEVQWIGRPGPRDHADRQTRHPAPLCTGGRLFIQGQERIVALDAYNGVPLWSLEIPGLKRYDIPHDSGNWTCNEEHLFVAIGNRCWQISTKTGEVERRLEVVPGQKASAAYDWGYVALEGETLVGSANLQNANSKGWWGGEFWRDEESNTIAASDNLFAIDARSGKSRWVYTGGIVPNTSITMAAGRIFFVESRNPQLISEYGGRVQLHDAWPDRWLVALDVTTGDKIWEVPLNIQGGQALFGMAWSEGKLVISSSGSGKYHVQAFDAVAGQPVWQQTVDWGGRGHGAQYSRPVIVQGTVFIRPFALDLASGKVLPARMPGGGCGTYCASRDALFFRSGDVSAWSPKTDQLSGFSRLRPGCWLSAIPAAGLLLSPEAGGGCSCGGWMETSIAFAPAEFPPPSFKTRDRNFIDQLPVEMFARIPESTIRYTLDGAEPNEASPVYSAPVVLTRAGTLKAATYFKSSGQTTARSTTATAAFVRQYPPPSIPEEVTTFTDRLTIELKKPGTTGATYYTLDGSEPTAGSARYEAPIELTTNADMAARTIWTHDDGQVAKSDIVRQRFYRVTKKLPREVSINFQHKSCTLARRLSSGQRPNVPPPAQRLFLWLDS